MKKKNRNKIWFAIFTFPTIFIFFTVVIIPFLMGIYYSFFQWDGIPVHPKKFIGLGNYINMFSDTRYINSILLTLKYTLIAAVLINILGLAFALLVTTKLKVRNGLRTMFFVPNLIGGLILGFIWQFIFMKVFVGLGESTGFHGIFFNWILDEKFALLAIAVVSTWQMAGYIMIIYITGIQSIPGELLEAAKVDGAGYFSRLKNIMFPLIAPSFTISLFLSLSNSFKIYDVNLSLTEGGPYNSTEMFAMNVYNEIFGYRNFGYGQSKAIMFFLFVALITLIQVYFSKRREVEM
ncbi:carbohydrate ABC transporter permease [Vallitalea guaymasensis]|uniref:Sugar ABC transporter permease n=1 Tax=Vallitalea guaymasensis TaxID=1185412 RepID=A0A8J8MC33_9FIRM|nr:sugar ABC transporter permease [Vallitalea guaymasensis]QUH29945.1 sugar ABC transporter permease [Vallitalea guaymasensis]